MVTRFVLRCILRPAPGCGDALYLVTLTRRTPRLARCWTVMVGCTVSTLSGLPPNAFTNIVIYSSLATPAQRQKPAFATFPPGTRTKISPHDLHLRLIFWTGRGCTLCRTDHSIARAPLRPTSARPVFGIKRCTKLDVRGMAGILSGSDRNA